MFILWSVHGKIPQCTKTDQRTGVNDTFFQTDVNVKKFNEYNDGKENN